MTSNEHTIFRIAEPLSENYQSLWYGYVDETGDVALHSAQPLVIIAVLTEVPRKLELLIRRLYKITGTRLKNRELEAAQLEPVYIERLLYGLSQYPIEIFMVEVDKKYIQRSPIISEEIYAEAMCELFRCCLSIHPRMEWHLDKRYNNRYRQLWLEQRIRDSLADVSGLSFVIRQEDSIICKPLQIADFVAWSAGQRKKGNSKYWEIIRNSIKKYELLQIEKWK